MNYFKIGGRQYRAEIRQGTPGEASFYAMLDPVGGGRCGPIFQRTSRPAARRALKRELERLAIGPDGKRANWSIVRRGPAIRIRVDVSQAISALYRVSDAIRRLGAESDRAKGAFGDLNQALAQNESSAGARKIIERAAPKVGIPVDEFVRRVRGEART